MKKTVKQRSAWRLVASLLGVALAAATFSACTVPTPLSRSYDDPYNSPTPDAVGPSSTRPDEEECIRTNSCAGLCKSDRDCEDDEFGYQSQCVSRNLELEEDEPAPKLGEPE